MPSFGPYPPVSAFAPMCDRARINGNLLYDLLPRFVDAYDGKWVWEPDHHLAHTVDHFGGCFVRDGEGIRERLQALWFDHNSLSPIRQVLTNLVTDEWHFAAAMSRELSYLEQFSWSQSPILKADYDLWLYQAQLAIWSRELSQHPDIDEQARDRLISGYDRGLRLALGV